MSKAFILTPQRTEFGREVRKSYDSHKTYYRRQDMRVWVPRNDGICNCISTVTKDNIILEI